MPGGRPTSYNEEIGLRICELTATTPLSLKSICAQVGTTVFSVLYWRSHNPEFAKAYARAKEDQADFLAEEIIEIADDVSNDTIAGQYGPIENKEWTNRSRLRVDARKWIAAKLKPKKYSEKLDVTSDGEKLQSGTIINLPTDKLKQLEQLLADGFTPTDNTSNTTGSPEGTV